MFITHYNPRAHMKGFTRGYDLLNSLLDNYERSQNNEVPSNFMPSINTREAEDAYHVEVDLPGIKKEDISLQVEDNTLLISGERKIKEEMTEENYYKVESRFGSFSRSFTLPEDVDVENIQAESVDGVLEVVIPKLKTQVEKVKKIAIK